MAGRGDAAPFEEPLDEHNLFRRETGIAVTEGRASAMKPHDQPVAGSVVEVRPEHLEHVLEVIRCNYGTEGLREDGLQYSSGSIVHICVLSMKLIGRCAHR